MKKLMAAVLLVVLALSFMAGILINRAEAASCYDTCGPCTCTIMHCCNGVCVDTGRRCPGFCRMVICQ